MEYKTVATTCTYCGTGCSILLEVVGENLSRVITRKSDPISEGRLCIKGWNAFAFVESSERLRHPLVKENGRFAPASWEKAVRLVAERLEAVRERSGPDSIGVLSSAKCTNEENYLVQKFTRAVLGTNNVDHCARL